MSTFGQRYGYEPVRDVFQVESMDDALRNSLWNVLHACFWGRWGGGTRLNPGSAPYKISQEIWLSHYKLPVDQIPRNWGGVVAVVRKNFFASEWFKVYSFVEFMANLDDDLGASGVPQGSNIAMATELAGYRFVDTKIAPITSETEIAEIETAISTSSAAPGVAVHLREALAKLSDRESPDYRNSIKESISAVESLANSLAGTTGQSLGPALSAIGADTHGALTEAFKKLYGWTSNAEGIRHSLMDESNLEFEDAKFMLVSCSAFVNYLTAKAARRGSTK